MLEGICDQGARLKLPIHAFLAVQSTSRDWAYVGMWPKPLKLILQHKDASVYPDMYERFLVHAELKELHAELKEQHAEPKEQHEAAAAPGEVLQVSVAKRKEPERSSPPQQPKMQPQPEVQLQPQPQLQQRQQPPQQQQQQQPNRSNTEVKPVPKRMKGEVAQPAQDAALPKEHFDQS